MNSAERLIRLFKYDRWATEKIKSALADHRDFNDREKAVSLFAHLINTQELWCRRITGQTLDDLELWPSGKLREISLKIETNTNQLVRLVEENSEKLDRTIQYENSKGVAYETILSDILHHLIIHGQHHRAQIAILIRSAGLTPPGTDFIFYTRTDAGSIQLDH